MQKSSIDEEMFNNSYTVKSTRIKSKKGKKSTIKPQKKKNIVNFTID